MRIDSRLYRLAYRSGRPPWDSGQPRPELAELTRDRAPGRALDPGCGTGTDVIYLASQGWEATGVDFVPAAIDAARSRAAAARSPARFVTGDVTRLSQAGISGVFDLVVDIGCYHAIPARRRDSYVAGVAAVTRLVRKDTEPPAGKAPGPLAVRVRGLAKSYSGTPAVRGIDLDIRSGEIFALLGAEWRRQARPWK